MDGLAYELQQRIKHDPYTRNHKINVEIADSSGMFIVTLSGRVQTYYQKQMATVAMQQEIKSRCNGTAHLLSLHNEIEVD